MSNGSHRDLWKKWGHQPGNLLKCLNFPMESSVKSLMSYGVRIHQNANSASR